MYRSKPKYIQEFAYMIDNGFLYTQLIHKTVKIYQKLIRELPKSRKKVPRSSGALLNAALKQAKYESELYGYLTKNGLPTEKAINLSIKLIGEDGKRSPLSKTGFQATYILGAAVGDYKDTSFEKAKAKRKKGSRNVDHSCKVESALRKELNKVRKAMDKVFSCDTAFGTCNNNSMSSGHCMLASLIVQDMYGGKIMSGQIGGIPHYWNKLCHMEVDLTGDQFKKPKIQIKKGELYSDSFEFNRDPFESLNQDFNKEVWSKHCVFRQKVREELEESCPELAEKLKEASKKLKR